MQGSAGFGIVKLRLGDIVRLKSDGPEGPNWRVAAYSYAKDTFDLMACNPRSSEQFRNGVAPEALEVIERVSDTK